MGDVRVVLPLGAVVRARRVLRGAMPSAIVVLVLVKLVDVRGRDCASAGHDSAAVAVTVCEREFRETGDAKAGARLAAYLLDSLGSAAGDRVTQIAAVLVPTLQQAKALRLLGEVALAGKRIPEALALFEAAHAAAIQLGDVVEVAHIAQVTGDLEFGRQRYGAALIAFARCITTARGRDPGVESVCHMDAVHALAYTGAYELAGQELVAAEQLQPEPGWSTRAWLEYTHGNLEQEREAGPARAGHDAIAVARFERALEYDAHAHDPRLARALHLNLAYSLTRLGELARARAHLAAAGSLDATGEAERDLRQAEAFLAHAEGHPALGTAIDTEIFGSSDADDQIDIAVLEARAALAEASGPHEALALRAAGQWASRGIAAAERVRAEQGVLELRPRAQARRRLPYELRFLALARAGQIDDALLALAAGQARTMQDAIATTAHDVLGEAARVRALETWLPAATPGALARPATPEAMRAVLRQIDLLALVVVDDEVWTITAQRGDVGGHRVGTLAELSPELETFERTPTDPALGRKLGDLLLSDAAFQVTDAPLHVLLDGRLAALPVAALRRAAPTVAWTVASDPPLAALRPTVRVPHLPTAWCAPVAPPRRARVLADPQSNLPETRVEAAAVSELGIDTRVFLGPAADRAALTGVGDGELLHLAVHTDVDAAGGAIPLADTTISALELATWRRDLPLVVLSSCQSARAHVEDLELDGSLAHAFLTAGARRVVATLRPVSDVQARTLTTRFYAAGGLAEPVHALARVQAALAATADTGWPLFTIFAQDTCSTKH